MSLMILLMLAFLLTLLFCSVFLFVLLLLLALVFLAVLLFLLALLLLLAFLFLLAFLLLLVFFEAAYSAIIDSQHAALEHLSEPVAFNMRILCKYFTRQLGLTAMLDHDSVTECYCAECQVKDDLRKTIRRQETQAGLCCCI